MFAADLEGSVVVWNRAAEELFGWKEAETIGRTFEVVVPDEARAEARRIFASCLRGEQVVLDTVRRRKDGSLIDVCITLGPVLDDKLRVRGCVGLATDETDHREKERERRDYQERFRKVFEESSDAILVIDVAANEIVDANPSACSLLRYEREELCGLPPSQVHPDEMPRLETFFRTVLEEGQARSGEFSYRTRAGEFVPCEVSASRIELSGRLHVCAMVRDISQRKRAQETLDRSFAELKSRTVALEKAHTELSQLASGVYHDLSEPLRAVSVYVKLLRQAENIDCDFAELAEYEACALEGLTRMRGLLDGLVRYAEVGRLEPTTRLVDAARVVEETIRALQPFIEECGATVTRDPLPTLPADPVQLGQVFQNLLSNALRFGRPGVPLVVHISAEEESGAWRFSVQDNGVGIYPKDQELVFDMFWRSGPRTSHGGSGIGLATCRRIIERSGGRIWVQSVPGKGSTFSFTLPGAPQGSAGLPDRRGSGEAA
jgi:PAS domain S-box-containing protein